MSTAFVDFTGGRADAEEYVQSIMSSQRITTIGTPASGRKRHLSLPNGSHETVKKVKGSIGSPGSPVDSSARVFATARRALYESPSPTSVDITATCASSNDSDAVVIETTASPSVEQLIRQLSTDVHSLISGLTARMDKLESGLEQKISTKVTQLLDKRVSSEMSKLRKDVDSRMEGIKDAVVSEVSADIDDINAKLSDLRSASNSSAPRDDISCNIIIRNMSESSNENVPNRVNALLRDGMKLRSVTVDTAVRKRSSNNKPGVIVASFRSAEDKQSAMSAKNKLKQNQQYERVYVDHDQSRGDRLLADNFRTILVALKHNDTNLCVRGSRVVRNNSAANRDSSSQHHRNTHHTYRSTGSGSRSWGGHHQSDNQRRFSGSENRDSDRSEPAGRPSDSWTRVTRGGSRGASRGNPGRHYSRQRH